MFMAAFLASVNHIRSRDGGTVQKTIERLHVSIPLDALGGQAGIPDACFKSVRLLMPRLILGSQHVATACCRPSACSSAARSGTPANKLILDRTLFRPAGGPTRGLVYRWALAERLVGTANADAGGRRVIVPQGLDVAPVLDADPTFKWVGLDGVDRMWVARVWPPR